MRATHPLAASTALALTLAVLAPSAHADQTPSAGRVLEISDGLFDAIELVERQPGRLTLQAEAVRIRGAGSIVDAGTSVTPLPRSIARAPSTSPSDLPVHPEEFRQASDPDDTLSFQKAAATKRIIQLKDGAGYVVCGAIGVWRGVLGDGATVKPCPGFAYPTETITVVTTGRRQPNTARQPLNALFYNANYLASSPIDDGLIFRGFTVDTRGTAVENDGQFHAIKVRMARDVTVDGVTVYGGGDCTAIQASDATVVRKSRCYGAVNAGIDHWEGPTNALVEDNVVVCAPRRGDGNGGTLGADAGVMFTGASTALADRQGANLTSRGNRISGGCNAGLFVNNLSPGSVLTNVASEGDTVDAAGNPAMIGILYEGNVQGGRIANATLKNGDGPTAILLRPDIIATAGAATTSGKPARVDISSVSILDWTTAAGNYSPLTLFGFGHTATGLTIRGGRNNTYTTTENASISISGTFSAASAYGAFNCLAGCTVPGVTTVGGRTTAR